MTYAKPQITKAAEAMEAIRDDNSLLKIIGGVESTDPHRMTPPAYSVRDTSDPYLRMDVRGSLRRLEISFQSSPTEERAAGPTS